MFSVSVMGPVSRLVVREIKVWSFIAARHSVRVVICLDVSPRGYVPLLIEQVLRDRVV